MGARTVQFPILGGTNRHRSVSADAQTTVNLYVDLDDQARAKGSLIGIPGLVEFSDTGSTGCRGSCLMGDIPYFVVGNTLYQILSDGTAGSLGAIGGTGPVGMATNGIQLLIVNGSQGYVYTTGTGLVSITDADFLPSYTCDYISGYFIVAEVGTGTWAVSAVDDATSWNAIDRANAESSPDGIQAIRKFNGEIHILGTNSREVWYNAANPVANPFTPNQGAQVDRGCLAKFSVATDSRAIYWLGDDLVVYAASHYTPEPISDAINYDLTTETAPEDAIGFCFQDQGHFFYCLTFPSGKSYVYDTTTGLWHRRVSFGMDRWRAVWPVKAYGKLLFGDSATGKIGYATYSAFTEYGNTMRWERTFPPLTQGTNLIFLDRFELVMESGTGGLGVNPVCYLETSTDGGRTYCDPIEANYGAVGQYTWRTFWCGLGSGENFNIRVWGSDPYCRNIVDGSISFEVGQP